MTIGIDISQLAYKGSGVANYLEALVSEILMYDRRNKYVFFYSSLRRPYDFNLLKKQTGPEILIKSFRFPPTLLDFVWNKLHIVPIEWLIGNVDLFITSDWTEPPSKGRKATFIYDLTVYKTPEEMSNKIVKVQKRKLGWVKKESDLIFTISESSKQDISEILKIDKSKIRVIYPGLRPIRQAQGHID
jgi:glycosyltransferase involved in cell wall biosynthesis